MNEKVEFTIKPNGEVEIDMIGFKGSSCADEVKTFLDALGGSAKSTKKNEFYQKEKVQVKQRRKT